MSYKFNPFTGQLDYFEHGAGLSLTFLKSRKVVDNAFLTDKKIVLSGNPVLKSEMAFLNGLLLSEECYNITGNEITFDNTIPFKIGHILNIDYVI